jgi:hypothetical protein
MWPRKKEKDYLSRLRELYGKPGDLSEVEEKEEEPDY